ncbi:hypothetical protein AWV79_27025 [Cupriavidus sp. UYMMa02A]|nr:hypothetical protein AWV79_27025 [Cupriavidus sp. UYMMa02A]
MSVSQINQDASINVKIVGPYQQFAENIESELTEIWLEEPWEIEKVRWGLIQGRAGSHKQKLSTIVNLESTLLNFGPDILYRLSYYVANEGWNPALPEAIKYITQKYFDLAGSLRSAGLVRLADAYDQYLALLERSDISRETFY